MTSRIDVTKPTSALAYTRDVRANFAIIKQEIEALQAYQAAQQTADSPTYTGTLHGAAAEFSGNVEVEGSLIVGTGVFADLTSHEEVVTVTGLVANFLVDSLLVRKMSSKFLMIMGYLYNNTGAPHSGANVARIPGTLLSAWGNIMPADLSNVNQEVDSCYISFTQSGANIVISANLFDAGVGANFPTDSRIAFNGIIPLQ